MQNPFNPVEQLLSLHARGRFAEMEQQARQLLRGSPNAPILNELLGISLSGQRKFSDALQYLLKAVRREPKDALFWENLALCQRELGEFAHAEKSLRQSLTLRPNNVEALNSWGSVLRSLDRLTEAQQAFEQVLRIAPEHGSAHFNLGSLQLKRNRLPEAETHLRKAILLGQQIASAHRLLGCALKGNGRLNEAESNFRRAMELEPANILTYANLASVYCELSRQDAAVELVRQAFDRLGDIRARLNAGTIDDLDTFAAILCDMHFYGDALRVYEATVPFDDNRKIALEAVYAARNVCKWQFSADIEERALDFGEDPVGQLPPFVALSLASATPAKQLSIAKNYAAKHRKSEAIVSPGRIVPAQSRDRLRLAYLSCDFYDHATSFLMAGVFEAHDRDRFEVVAYDHSPITTGRYHDRLVRAFDGFVPVHDLTIDGLAQRIAADGIDLLVDLKGWTEGSRTHMLESRPAPIQIQWLGFPGTLGAPWFDYVIADRILIPAGDEVFYSEKVVRLPDCYQPNDDQRASPTQNKRSDCGLPEGAFVFGCFNQAYKLTPDVFNVWMRLLKEIDYSVLWLLESGDQVAAALRTEAAARGIAADRIIFAEKRPNADHLARVPHVDLALDCFPYTSHTTASDMLWGGVPLVALSGETFASRVSESILTAAGLDDLVTRSLDAYFELALRLATDRDFFAGVKARVRDCKRSALFDTRRFTQNLERGFELMWQRHAAGLPPDHIDVPSPETAS